MRDLMGMDEFNAVYYLYEKEAGFFFVKSLLLYYIIK